MTTSHDTAIHDGRLEEGPSGTVFSASYKQSVLDEIERQPDSVRAVLDREGLYFADILRWREQAARGRLTNSFPPRQLRSDDAPGSVPELELRLAQLHAAVSLTEASLAKARERFE